MKEHNKFLEEYKRLEANVRTFENMQIKEYEDWLNDDGRVDDAEKLRYCRNVRNFLSHHSDSLSFVGITTCMIEFIVMLNEEISEEDTPVKKKMISLSKALLDSSNIMEASAYLSSKKLPIAPVFTKTGDCAGVITQESILKAIADGNSVKTTKLSNLLKGKPSLKSCIYLSANDPYSVTFGAPSDKVFLIKEQAKDKICGFVVNK